MDEYYRAVKALPEWLAQPLAQLPAELAENVQEVRLKAGGGVCLRINGRQCAISGLPQCPPGLQGRITDGEQLEDILYHLCGGSVHSHQAELAAGYVTTADGCRVGVGGQYAHIGQDTILQTVSSLNMRIARSKRIVLPSALCNAVKGHFTGLLIAGEPGSGKTTLLRQIADTIAACGRAIAVIDERRELFPPINGQGGADALLPDVISGLPKGQALQMALRTLSPEVVLFDELGGMDEVTALEQGFFSGVDFVASVHTANLTEAFRRPQVQYLKNRDMLHIIVMLEGSSAPGKIREVYFT